MRRPFAGLPLVALSSLTALDSISARSSAAFDACPLRNINIDGKLIVATVMILAELNPTMLFMLGALLIMTVVLRRARRSTTSAPESASPRLRDSAPAGRHGELPSGVTQWEVRMHDLTRELSGQLDAKMIVIEQLLRRVEQQTARLELAIAEAQRWGLGPPPAAAGNLETGLEDDWRATVDAARTLADNLAPNSAARAVSEQVRRQVAALSARGESADAIARQLDRPVGEVELLLSVLPDPHERG